MEIYSKKRVPEPKIARSLTLSFTGDWGQANFHRVCSILAQEFGDRSGPKSRVCIWTFRHGGFEVLPAIQDGDTQLTLATPAGLIAKALIGDTDVLGDNGIFPQPMPNLRTLAVLPQNDKMVLAIDSKFGIRSFEELLAKKPALRIATGLNDGTCFIGHVAMRYMEAHGISEDTLKSWGGSYLKSYRPDISLGQAHNGEVDAVLQEAIMTPWWQDVIEGMGWVPLPILPAAAAILEREVGLKLSELPKGFWKNLNEPLPALDFSDFLVLVRDDLPDDVAYLLTWCLVEKRDALERGYRHLPPDKSPLSYPLVPERMARPAIPLHVGARRYFEEAGYL